VTEARRRVLTAPSTRCDAMHRMTNATNDDVHQPTADLFIRRNGIRHLETPPSSRIFHRDHAAYLVRSSVLKEVEFASVAFCIILVRETAREFCVLGPVAEPAGLRASAEAWKRRQRHVWFVTQDWTPGETRDGIARRFQEQHVGYTHVEIDISL
jgi:hypothetical protein